VLVGPQLVGGLGPPPLLRLPWALRKALEGVKHQTLGGTHCSLILPPSLWERRGGGFSELNPQTLQGWVVLFLQKGPSPFRPDCGNVSCFPRFAGSFSDRYIFSIHAATDPAPLFIPPLLIRTPFLGIADCRPTVPLLWRHLLA